MLKYFDAKDKYVVDEPSLWTVNGSIDILYAGGTEHKSGNFTIQIGNIEAYNPTEVDSEPEPEITPQQPESIEDKGKLLYKVGLISDIHFDTNPSVNKNSEYQEDLINALNYFRNNNVSFIANCGDICEYEDSDYESFKDVYTAHAWAPTNTQLRLFTALGNHDYWKMYTNGNDISKLLQCFNVFTGEDLWTNYGYKEKTDYIQFFEYDGVWNKQYYADRTTKSKLSYWFEHKGDIYVFLSIDYGTDTGEVWDELTKGYHLLDKNDKYVKQMKEYVSDTNYTSENGSFDYQFYNPNQLIWLKDIIENNLDKRIFVFSHHFLPHKAGDPEGMYSHLRIWPYSQSALVRRLMFAGSNTLCGLTFWFIDKLNNTYSNVMWFSGHCHRAWNENVSICTHDYTVKKPTGDEYTPTTDNIQSLTNTPQDYRLYTRESDIPCGNCAPWVSLPSLSKPVDNNGSSMYQASQGGILEVYENCVTLKEINFKDNNSATYVNEVIRDVDFNI